MKNSRHHDWQLPFIDMLLLMVALFVSLYIITLLQINPPEKKALVDMKAEFVITMTWPDKSFDDIDLHLFLPSQEMVNFSKKESRYVTLDRDDLGVMNDRYNDESGEHLIEKNQEILTIRAIVPGVYIVNVHAYREVKYWTLGETTVESTPALPYPVKVTLQKLNPQNKELISTIVTLAEIGEQKTAFSFKVDTNGNVSEINTNADIPFIPKRPVQASLGLSGRE